jgi:hypothetical protein
MPTRNAIQQTRLLGSFAMMSLTLALWTGCETQRGTGTVAGAGIGALIGQAAGGNTQSTVIGAAIGAGAGHAVGSAGDRRTAERERDAAQTEAVLAQNRAEQAEREAAIARAERNQAIAPFQLPPSPLNNTTWQLLTISPEPDPPVRSMVVEFRPDGSLVTKRVYTDGSFVTESETFSVVGDTLVINRPGQVVLSQFAIAGNQLIMTCERARTVLMRVGG